MLDVGDINIDTNVITTKSFNSNFYIRPSGTGAIVVEDLRFSANVLSSTGSNDIEFAPGGQDIGITATGSLKVPAGTEAQRPSTATDVRFNTTTNFFELFSTAYTPLRGIWSEDRNTYVLANVDNSSCIPFIFDFTLNKEPEYLNFFKSVLFILFVAEVIKSSLLFCPPNAQLVMFCAGRLIL